MKISEEKKGDEGSMVGINLGAICNQSCLFCLAVDGKEMYPRLTFDAAMEVINGHIERGGQSLMFTGGECTLHPNFVEIVAATVKDKRVTSLNIMTNGVRLGDKEFFDSIIAVDPEEKVSFSFSLHGSTAELSREITRGQKGDFERTCAAMKYALQSDRSVDVAILVLQQNYKSLPGYARFIIKEFPKISGVSFGYPLLCGNARINQDRIYVKFSEMGPYLREALRLLLENGINAVTAAGAPMPLCATPGIEEVAVRPLVNWARRYIGTATSGRLNSFKNEDELLPKVKPEQCKRCVINDACVGVLTSYMDIFGSDGIMPTTMASFKGPIIKGQSLAECLPKLDKTKLNLIILSGDSAVSGLYGFPNKEIGVVISEKTKSSFQKTARNIKTQVKKKSKVKKSKRDF